MPCKYPQWRIDYEKARVLLSDNWEKRVHNGGIIIQRPEYEYFMRKAPLLKPYISQVPCGKCTECILKSAGEWASRCMMEAKLHEENVFVTFTYDKDHLKFARHIDIETGEVDIRPTLYKKDAQDFFKRLRRKLEYRLGYNYPIKYFLGGEYGEKFERPHYHAILFNLSFSDMKLYGESDPANGVPLYTSKFLDETWQNGACIIGNVDWESCAYVARYTMKKLTAEENRRFKYYNAVFEDEAFDSSLSSIMNELVPWQEPFRIASKRPAIARTVYDDKKDVIYETDEVFVKRKGVYTSQKPPKYFDKLFKEENPQRMEEVKKTRQRIAENATREKLESTNLTEAEYLEMQSRKKEQSVKALRRTLED